ncbi:MAG: c-type cytochrome [Planctomycetes bacterium]|nr:c-type cytochrome [Planctomycetota bacterium]
MFRWLIVLVVALLVTVPADAQKKKPKPVDDAIHDPAVAVKNLDVHPELQATLFVSEPKITNPTNLDIDHRGRVWLCDVKNYRSYANSRPAGDRILILEDTKGTGVADKVMGNKVIVSCSPNVLVFTFDENDKVTKKEVLFTKTGIAQHDHSAHSFVFGPDGRLYWNFGNTGGAVHDKNGKPVIDLAGHVVKDGGNPYRGGMVFRCEMDGSNFEVLGHNFRNNYEVAVDSFGTLWQSDNDDDGNRGVRINYVMEYGNYGYLEEFTGAGWQKPRTNMEKEIPLRHWHLNDPGVVPNLLQTYQGSPTGICVYEGTLLPKVFHNQMIHCDAGPSIVRAYPVVPDGAGYKVTKTVDILDGSKKNNWFRPADVCVAPDGSIFVTDWYDPGVGGHAQRDLDRGRVFRVAPPGVKYTVPKVKFETIDDNIEALKSPNLATRYIAWRNLHNEGAKAEAALLKLYDSKVPHERARALWLLGRIEGKGQHYVELAIKDKDPNIRITALRLARQLRLNLIPIVNSSLVDANQGFYPAVLRECAIALRHSKNPDAARAWGRLARLHNGKDRWYLEALGIAADGNWDRFLESFIEVRPWIWDEQRDRDMVWRSRAAKTPAYLAELISSVETSRDELPRMLRAFDFQKDSDIKTEALVKLAFGSYSDKDRAKFITSEAISRLKNFDVAKNPKHAAALDKVLDGARGTTSFVEMVGKFNVAKRYPELLAIAQKQPTEQIGVDAIRTLFDKDQGKLIRAGLESSDKSIAASTAQAIAGAGHDKANALLLPIVTNEKLDLELRRQATRALGRNQTGAKELIRLVEKRELSKELYAAADSILNLSTSKDIREQALRLFPPPTTKDKKPLPAISDLVKQKCNVANGASVFAKAGTCAKCHQVNGDGKNVGPDLSEIGKKLAREAIFESILYPSASIAHNFETYVVETKKGTTASGLLVSQTKEEVTIKDAESIVRTFKTADIESFTKSPTSLMPADLHHLITTQELVDVVEYMLTLREARKK